MTDEALTNRSWWLVIDGYNVVKPSAAPRRQPVGRVGWLQAERQLLIGRLVEHLPAKVRRRTLVVFDAKDPPVGVVDRYETESIVVRFAVGYDEADDLIEEVIAGHHSPKQLMVVSSDNRIITAASRRSARTMDSDQWTDRLVDGRVDLAVPRSKYESAGEDGAGQGGGMVGGGDVDRWLKEFGLD